MHPWVERVRLLTPVVLEEAFRRSGGEEATLRRLALAAAAGRLHRFGLAHQALGEPVDHELSDVVAAALPAILASWRPRSTLLQAAHEELVRVLRAARTAPQAPPLPDSALATALSQLAARLSRSADRTLAADRLARLEEADDALSLAAGASAAFDVGQLTPQHVAACLQLAQLLSAGLDDETRWLVVDAARREAIARELFTDPFGDVLWCGLIDPDCLAALLERAAAQLDQPGSAVRLAAADPGEAGQVGEVAALLWNEPDDVGYTAMLRIRHQPGRVSSPGVARLGPAAWEAVRTAFRAACRLLPEGVPPDALEAFSVELDASAEIDGGSLGLPAALAFYSLWTGVRFPRGSAATGVLDRDGRVHAVQARGLAAKVRTWKAQYGGSGAPALAPAQPGAPAVATPCDSLAGALAALGVEPTLTPTTSHLGDVATRSDQLAAAMRAVERQDLGNIPVIEGASPWLVLADRIEVLTSSLEGTPDLGLDLHKARILGALAYTHAARVGDALSLLQRVDTEGMRAESRLLLAIVRLNRAIDAPGEEDERHRADLERWLEDESIASGFRMSAMGTLGRFHLHRGRVAQALDLLAAAVAAAPDSERARSRIYLAMAARENADAQRALDELDRAESELRTHTLPRSRSYYAQTMRYLDYERARAFLALARPSDALTAIQKALQGPDAPRGFWPLAGFTRTLAASQLRLGRRADWERTMDTLRPLIAAAQPEYAELAAGLLREAEGEHAGVIY